MRKILEEAVAVGNATARAIWIHPRDKAAYFFKDSDWYTGFVGGHHEFLKNGGAGGRNLDARVLFHYMATVITPAMVNKMVGAGSQYALLNLDENGNYMDGSKTYKLNLPANVPAKDFWSIVAYDPQTRSQLQTGQPFPGRNNQRHKLDVNKDGSIDLYFRRRHPRGRTLTGYKRYPAKAGSLHCVFMARWTPGSTRNGSLAKLNWLNEIYTSTEGERKDTTPTRSTTSQPRRTKTAALPFTSAATPRRTISCPSSQAGITS